MSKNVFIFNLITIFGWTNLLRANVCPDHRLPNIFFPNPQTQSLLFISFFLSVIVRARLTLQWASRVWFIEGKRPVICTHNGKHKNLSELLTLWGRYWCYTDSIINTCPQPTTQATQSPAIFTLTLSVSAEEYITNREPNNLHLSLGSELNSVL